MTSGVDSRVVPVSDANEMIAVKDSNSLDEVTMIRAGDFDCTRHCLLSEEELALVGTDRSKKWFES
jgi:hypothetical protein